MLAVGMAAWVLRYGLFAAAADDQVFWMIFLGVLLHGICYDFFFVTGMIYVDKKSTKAIRNQAQGFLVLVTQGLGLGLGSTLFFAWYLMNTSAEGVVDWKGIWFTPAVFAAVIMVGFIVLFWDKVTPADEAEVAAADAKSEYPKKAPRDVSRRADVVKQTQR
jgi:MFS family permease